jgi:hypothetical protein
MENEDIYYSDFRAELSFKSGSGRNGNNERCMERDVLTHFIVHWNC